MTNNDIKQELDSIHLALKNLLSISKKKGVKAKDMQSLISMTKRNFEDVSTDAISRLEMYEIVEKERMKLGRK